MTTQGLTINQHIGMVLDLETQDIQLYVNGQPACLLTPEEMENFATSYAQLRVRVMPLNEASVAFMIQNLAGDGFLTMRAMARTPSGYVMKLVMKRGGPRWTVRNFGDWYRALDEAHLEAAKRGWL